MVKFSFINFIDVRRRSQTISLESKTFVILRSFLVSYPDTPWARQVIPVPPLPTSAETMGGRLREEPNECLPGSSHSTLKDFS